jgi:acetyl esterase/lipase
MMGLRAAGILLLACFVVSGVEAKPGTGVWKSDCKCFRDVIWGSEVWVDKTYPPGRQNFQQSLDFWPVRHGATKQPLIIWAHPGGGTKYIVVQSDPKKPTLYDRIIVPARANGFAVASLEYRHPVHNDDIVPAPHVDIGLAVQSIRAMADSLGIDPNNIFLMGGSQGNLVVWQGVQPDMQQPGADGPAGRSSLVNAVYGYNAQATYRGQEIADMFLVPEDRQPFVDDWMVKHPQDPLFGSAIDSVTPAAPPLIVKYERAYFHRLVRWDELTVHHPDYGLAICEAYAAAGIPDRCQTFELVPKDQDYAGAYPFFLSHMAGSAGAPVQQPVGALVVP